MGGRHKGCWVAVGLVGGDFSAAKEIHEKGTNHCACSTRVTHSNGRKGSKNVRTKEYDTFVLSPFILQLPGSRPIHSVVEATNLIQPTMKNVHGNAKKSCHFLKA